MAPALRQSACRHLISALVGLAAAACAEGAEGTCSGGDDNSLLQASRSRVGLAKEAAGSAGQGAGEAEASYAGAFIAQEVSALFYRPHYTCGSPYVTKAEAGNPSHVKQWLEEVMTGTEDGNGKTLKPPDFLGLSEMESSLGVPGNDVNGYENYRVIGAMCQGNTTNTKYLDPIGLYYDSKAWHLIESYPPNKKLCGQFPPAQYGLDASQGTIGKQWQCKPGKVSPGDDTCCACTQSENVANQEFYGGSPNGTYFNYQGTRPFVIGKFRSKHTRRKVCVVTFNLPHQILADCSSTPTAACFGNAANSAARVGTEQIVKATNEVCQGTPIIFMGDTNSAGGSYDTSFLFYNPFNKDVSENSVVCPQASPLLALRDPPSDLQISGQPYTCCQDGDGGVNRYASDRVAASGPSWVSGGSYFVPRTLRGGARQPGEAVAEPLSVGTGATCCDVNEMFVGLPCCGAKAEHAPVWGVYDLFGH